MKKYIPILAIAATLFTGCLKDQMEALRSEMDSLKNDEIASLQQQVKNITTSVDTLGNLSVQLKAYLGVLSEAKGALEQSLTEMNTKLADVQSELQKETSAAKQELAKSLESAKSSLETQLATINSTLAALTEKDASLDRKLDSLKAYSDATYATEDWVSGTFVTLAAQNALIEDVTAVKAQVEALKETIANISKDVRPYLASAMEKAKSTINGNILSMVSQLTKYYEEALDEAATVLDEAFTKDLEKAIASSESTITSWINDQLKGYYLASDAKEKVAAYYKILGNVPEGKSLQGEIDELNSGLTVAKDTITTNYKKFIADAILKSDGAMSDSLSNKIKALHSTVLDDLTGRVGALQTKTGLIVSRLQALNDSINTISGQIESIQTSIKVLDSLKMTLQQYVESVQGTLTTADQTNYNLLVGYINTLRAKAFGEGANSLQSRINALNSLIGTLPEGATDLISWTKATLAGIDEQFDLYCELDDITEYETLVKKTLGQQAPQIKRIEDSLKVIIEKSRTTIDGWISDKLQPYADTTGVKDSLTNVKAQLAGSILSEDEKISNSIKRDSTKLDSLFKDIHLKYAAAVADAISQKDGYITDSIKNTINGFLDAESGSIAKIKDSLKVVSGKIKKLDLDIIALGERIDSLKGVSGSLCSFIDTTKYKSLQGIIDVLNDSLSKCPTKYASLAEYYRTKSLVESYVNRADSVTMLAARLKAAEENCNAIDTLIKGYLKDGQITDSLSNILYGENGLDTILSLLEGEINGDSPENSLNAKLDSLEKHIIQAESLIADLERVIVLNVFSSVAFMPENSDGTVAKDADGYYMDFVVRPINLAKALVDCWTADNGCIKILKSDLKEYSCSVTLKSKEDGTITVRFKNSELNSGNYVALSVKLTQVIGGKTEKALNFTSKFEKLN